MIKRCEGAGAPEPLQPLGPRCLMGPHEGTIRPPWVSRCAPAMKKNKRDVMFSGREHAGAKICWGVLSVLTFFGVVEDYTWSVL